MNILFRDTTGRYDAINEIINLYTSNIKNVLDSKPPGTIRAVKGKTVEDITELIIRSAWLKLGANINRLTFQNEKIKIHLNQKNLCRFPKEFQYEIRSNIDQTYYMLKVDKHVCIDGKFVVGIECKSYTENAMLKRILVDFQLLKTEYSDLRCCLLQLETWLGGENTSPSETSRVANSSTYTLMSHFPDVELQIITLLEGSRDILNPIHKKGYFKEMKSEYVAFAIDRVSKLLSPFK